MPLRSFFIFFLALAFLTFGAKSAKSQEAAAGPVWGDSGVDLPLRHAVSPTFATTGEGSEPWGASWRSIDGEWGWQVFPLNGVTSVTAVNGPVLVDARQRVMRGGQENWMETYRLDEPSGTILLHAWEIIVDGGILITIDSGATWEKHPAPDWNPRAITRGGSPYDPTYWLVVGDRGEVFASANRIAWTRLPIGTDEDLVAAAPLFSGYVVVAASGRVFTASGDLSRWTDHGLRLPPGVTRIHGERPLFAILEDGRVFTSAAGRHWSERVLPEGERAVSVSDWPRHRPVIVAGSGRLLRAHHMIPFISAFHGQEGMGELNLAVTYASQPLDWLLDGESLGISVARCTATESGRYRVRMSHPEGDILTDAFEVWVRETFEEWRQREFSEAELADPEISGPGADPAGSGNPNLLRFVLGEAEGEGTVGHPMVMGAAGNLPDWPRLGFSFVRRKEAGGVHYVLETSPDMSSWSLVDSAAFSWIEDLGEAERVTLPSPMTVDDDGKGFLRLRVGLDE
jgi:hypothetical protein